MESRYIVRKYVMAKDISEAIKIEKNKKPDECWVDPEWLKLQDDTLYKGKK